jgi:hypothetical protein
MRYFGGGRNLFGSGVMQFAQDSLPTAPAGGSMSPMMFPFPTGIIPAMSSPAPASMSALSSSLTASALSTLSTPTTLRTDTVGGSLDESTLATLSGFDSTSASGGALVGGFDGSLLPTDDISMYGGQSMSMIDDEQLRMSNFEGLIGTEDTDFQVDFSSSGVHTPQCDA